MVPMQNLLRSVTMISLFISISLVAAGNPKSTDREKLKRSYRCTALMSLLSLQGKAVDEVFLAMFDEVFDTIAAGMSCLKTPCPQLPDKAPDGKPINYFLSEPSYTSPALINSAGSWDFIIPQRFLEDMSVQSNVKRAIDRPAPARNPILFQDLMSQVHRVIVDRFGAFTIVDEVYDSKRFSALADHDKLSLLRDFLALSRDTIAKRTGLTQTIIEKLEEGKTAHPMLVYRVYRYLIYKARIHSRIRQKLTPAVVELKSRLFSDMEEMIRILYPPGAREFEALERSSFGERLAAIRKALGLTLHDVERVWELDITYNTIYRWETGYQEEPHYERVSALLQYYIDQSSELSSALD